MKKEQWVVLSLIILFVISIAVSYKQPAQLANNSGSQSFFSQPGIAVIDINGPISFDTRSSTFFPSGADLILKQIQAVEDDSQVKGLVLRINSPGGTVGASQEIYAALLRLKQLRQLPIVAQIGDVGASGAYYAALGADTIFANPGSLVGSIGVILSSPVIEEFAKTYGIDNEVYKSGPYKDILSLWRKSTHVEEQLLQSLVDNVHAQFRQAFIDSRKLLEKDARRLSQGQIFTGEQALELDIIDKLGGYRDAIIYMGLLTGLGEDPHIIIQEAERWMDIVNMFNATLQQGLSRVTVPFVPRLY